MTKEEAIKYLQQLYPNGGNCWLNEQRIKAIGMDIKALQEEPVNEDLDLGCGVIWKCEEPVSEDLREASRKYFKSLKDSCFISSDIMLAFKAGAKWQKKYLWKSADGEDLPEYEREVVVFTQDFPNDAGIMKVAIAHRPDPKGWDGKSIATGEVEHYTPKTYGKGGWNIPDVKYWLDLSIPNLEED